MIWEDTMAKSEWGREIEIQVRVEGKLLKGWYHVEGRIYPLVTVRTATGQKTAQRGSSDAESVARMLLVELAKEGKA
jgi:hypothetical protein